SGVPQQRTPQELPAEGRKVRGEFSSTASGLWSLVFGLWSLVFGLWNLDLGLESFHLSFGI
ncbi:MAG: hypothetical protein ACRD6N_03955, partial [Pyrinomonadaceae bacterium]